MWCKTRNLEFKLAVVCAPMADSVCTDNRTHRNYTSTNVRLIVVRARFIVSLKLISLVFNLIIFILCSPVCLILIFLHYTRMYIETKGGWITSVYPCNVTSIKEQWYLYNIIWSFNSPYFAFFTVSNHKMPVWIIFQANLAHTYIHAS